MHAPPASAPMPSSAGAGGVPDVPAGFPHISSPAWFGALRQMRTPRASAGPRRVHAASDLEVVVVRVGARGSSTATYGSRVVGSPQATATGARHDPSDRAAQGVPSAP